MHVRYVYGDVPALRVELSTTIKRPGRGRYMGDTAILTGLARVVVDGLLLVGNYRKGSWNPPLAKGIIKEGDDWKYRDEKGTHWITFIKDGKLTENHRLEIE